MNSTIVPFESISEHLLFHKHTQAYSYVVLLFAQVTMNFVTFASMSLFSMNLVTFAYTGKHEFCLPAYAGKRKFG